VDFHPHSFADPDGRVFRWQDGLYRGLRREQAELFRSLLEDGVLDSLSRQGILVETEAAPVVLEGYDLVLRHREIPFPSYPTEWCTAMFAAAARAYLDLFDQLLENGLGLKDVHAWNLVYEATCPRFVDLTSIARAEECSPASLEEKYRRYYVFPLQLMTAGHAALARSLLLEFDGVRQADVELLTGTLARRMGRVSRRLRRPAADLEELIRRLRREIEPVLDAVRLEPGKQAAAGELEQAVASVLGRLRPTSALLFDAPAALPELSLGDGRSLVVVDSDEQQSAARYARARAQGLPILPLLMDFRKPTPSIGYSGHFSIAATQRLRCTLTVAIDLVPRLAAQPFLTFDHVSEGLALFAERWALVGFGRARLADPARRPPPWYREEELLRALGARFAKVERAASVDGTVLFLCEK